MQSTFAILLRSNPYYCGLYFVQLSFPSFLFYLFHTKQTFAIRFASSEIAQEYKAEFGKAQAEMQKLLAGGDATEGAAEADEAASALESLNVKAEEPAEKKEEA